jgi:hypothetical protein
MSEDDSRIEAALNIAMRYGGTDESHHARWVIDQMVRCLTGTKYDRWVAEYRDGEDGPQSYEWDVGIPP